MEGVVFRAASDGDLATETWACDLQQDRNGNVTQFGKRLPQGRRGRVVALWQAQDVQG